MNIYLKIMNLEDNRTYWRYFQYDSDIFKENQKIPEYLYQETDADKKWHRQKELGRIHLAVMLGSQVIGEVILKNISNENHSCTLSIHLINDTFKNRGFGTAAEKQALHYAFDNLGMEIVFADALITNRRSLHVLKKAGFQEIHRDDEFVYLQCSKSH